ncbi:hypothetical protein NIE88_17325 [Sporolactobacillus shoreicorticis]|uniref:DPH-type MB domain-containing protein n=1 Tax=Sporolactobacillus shoreicorticis TaxID=1923877 RepID=A0ABW5S027_9BACL|nr:hypothetical protein [Sporolactobacillus shoreicorticis]MCO7127521.1 hypothetical protein [Sporolactobacillus shoreicorticis]
MNEKKKRDERDLEWLGEDSLSEQRTNIITFQCQNCDKEDDIPDFVVDEFNYDREADQELEVACPYCGGTMKQARKSPK